MRSSQGASLPNTRASEIQYLIVLHEDSSSATTSNLPGPARVMGKLFSFLGAKLERRINLSADRLGYGPLAYRRKLSKKYSSLRWALVKMTPEQRRGMVKKLMRYVSSGMTLTQSQTLELIFDLITADVTIGEEFMKAGLYTELQDLWIYCNMARKQYQYLARRDPDIDLLLASSRKALIFVEENEVNTVVKPLLSLKKEEIWAKPYRDKFAILSLLLHAYTVLLRQSHPKERKNGPVSQLAFAYYTKLRRFPSICFSPFHPEMFAAEFLVTPLPTDMVELYIRAHLLSHFPSHSTRTARISVRHCIFKSLTEGRKLRYYCTLQQRSAYRDAYGPGVWDNIPLPCIPREYSGVEMELISVTNILADFSKLDELRFSLPKGLDNAIICDTSWYLPSDYCEKIQTRDYLTVWEPASES